MNLDLEQRLSRLERLLTAVVALMASDRDSQSTGQDPRRTELVLADVGLTVTEIAEMTGRNYEAVKSSIRRAKSNGKT